MQASHEHRAHSNQIRVKSIDSYNNMFSGRSRSLRNSASHCAPTAPSTTLWSQLSVTDITFAARYLQTKHLNLCIQTVASVLNQIVDTKYNTATSGLNSVYMYFNTFLLYMRIRHISIKTTDSCSWIQVLLPPHTDMPTPFLWNRC